jgi:nucleotide-binding universal stress UspA family protein
MSIGPIIVGYDDQPAAQRALERALATAKSSDAAIVVVAVEEMPLDPEGPQNFGTLDDSPATMIPLVVPPELDRLLQHAKTQVEAAGVEGDYVWAAGNPAITIADVAEDRNASLVVLGAHHHGFMARLLGADVAGEVKRRLTAEIVVVD